MHNDHENHVKKAEMITKTIGKLLDLRPHDDSNAVQLKFAGLRAYETATALGAKAQGRIFVLPTFEVSEKGVVLDKIIVLDGMSLPGRTIIMGCDLVRHCKGLYGLLERSAGETNSYILKGSRAIVFRDVRQPLNAKKIVEAGARALAAKTPRVRAKAA